MKDKKYILQRIKNSVQQAEPGATLILYGSYARGEEMEDSDIDILILIDSEKDRVPWADEEKIISPICKIEIETETVITPIIYSRKKWANHRMSPFFENVKKDGIVL